MPFVPSVLRAQKTPYSHTEYQAGGTRIAQSDAIPTPSGQVRVQAFDPGSSYLQLFFKTELLACAPKKKKKKKKKENPPACRGLGRAAGPLLAARALGSVA
jgi:hypothetical protein